MYYQTYFFLVLMFTLIASHESKRTVKVNPELKAKIEETVSTCAKITNTPEELWGYIKRKDYEDTERFRVFLHCMAMDTGLFGKDGVPNLDALFQLLFKDEDVQEVLKNCKENLTGDRAVDKVYNFVRCYQEKSPVNVSFD